MRDFSTLNDALASVPVDDWPELSQVHQVYSAALAVASAVVGDYTDRYTEVRWLTRDPDSGNVTDVTPEAENSAAENVISQAIVGLRSSINYLQRIAAKYEDDQILAGYATRCKTNIKELLDSLS